MGKFHVVLQLIKRDLVRYKRNFWSKLIDTASILVTNLIVFGYLMAHYGLGGSYGPFMLISAIASFGFFDTVGKVSELISDIEGDKTISYTLTLPIPSWLVFFYIGIWWSINSILVTIFLFPMGKLILFQNFDLSQINFLHLLLIYISTNLFYGFFSLWLTSLLKNMGNVGNLWVRVINPILMFGAYFYSWKAVFEVSPVFAWIDLLNPMVYIMEGMRAAALGQAEYLPFWVCLPVVWFFIIIFAVRGISRLQNRLDVVR